MKDRYGVPVGTTVSLIINDVLECGVTERDIRPHHSLREDLRATPEQMWRIIFAFEEVFDLEIPDDDAEKIFTVRDAIDYIEMKQEEVRQRVTNCRADGAGGIWANGSAVDLKSQLVPRPLMEPEPGRIEVDGKGTSKTSPRNWLREAFGFFLMSFGVSSPAKKPTLAPKPPSKA